MGLVGARVLARAVQRVFGRLAHEVDQAVCDLDSISVLNRDAQGLVILGPLGRHLVEERITTLAEVWPAIFRTRLRRAV